MGLYKYILNLEINICHTHIGLILKLSFSPAIKPVRPRMPYFLQDAIDYYRFTIVRCHSFINSFRFKATALVIVTRAAWTQEVKCACAMVSSGNDRFERFNIDCTWNYFIMELVFTIGYLKDDFVGINTYICTIYLCKYIKLKCIFIM